METPHSRLDRILELVYWTPIEACLAVVYSSRREKASWPPLGPVPTMLLAAWHNLLDIKLASAF